MSMPHYPVITAEEALAQGSEPSMFFSIARFTNDGTVAGIARSRGRELAILMGMDLGGRRKKPTNDNRRQPKRDGGRRAA